MILGIIIITAIISKSGYELSVEKSELVAYANLRYSIAQAAASSGGDSTLKSEYIDTLVKLLKSVDSNNQCFSSNSGVFYGGTADTYCFLIYCLPTNWNNIVNIQIFSIITHTSHNFFITYFICVSFNGIFECKIS